MAKRRHRQTTNFVPQRRHAVEYTDSKTSNSAEFDPWAVQSSTAYWSFMDKPPGNRDGHPIIRFENAKRGFIIPFSQSDLEEVLSGIPKKFVAGLKAIFVLGGSVKQQKTANSNLFRFGEYWNECVFLFAYPLSLMTLKFKHMPSPGELTEYSRAGAQIGREKVGGFVRFDRKSLKKFYLNAVFIHEVGHHANRHKGSNDRKEEGFAEWFAIHHGYKRRFRG